MWLFGDQVSLCAQSGCAWATPDSAMCVEPVAWQLWLWLQFSTRTGVMQAFGKSAAASAEPVRASGKSGSPAAAMAEEADDVQLSAGGKVKAFLGAPAACPPRHRRAEEPPLQAMMSFIMCSSRSCDKRELTPVPAEHGLAVSTKSLASTHAELVGCFQPAGALICREIGTLCCPGALKPVYWQALAVVVVLYFARFDWSFVVLRAKQVRA